MGEGGTEEKRERDEVHGRTEEEPERPPVCLAA